mmetsp:Transcript_457/g.445  ORF Transcript_457/g.445 Transcript_457/m.445 type:complete len:115 (+) Transcript_457:97-441(+)
MSFSFKTPGLFLDEQVMDQVQPFPDGERIRQSLIDINRLLQKISFYQKQDKVNDFKAWIDQHCKEAVFETLFKFYTQCDFPLIEVTLPCFSAPVLYMDVMYEEPSLDYVYPPNL